MCGDRDLGVAYENDVNKAGLGQLFSYQTGTRLDGLKCDGAPSDSMKDFDDG